MAREPIFGFVSPIQNCELVRERIVSTCEPIILAAGNL